MSTVHRVPSPVTRWAVGSVRCRGSMLLVLTRMVYGVEGVPRTEA